MYCNPALFHLVALTLQICDLLYYLNSKETGSV